MCGSPIVPRNVAISSEYTNSGEASPLSETGAAHSSPVCASVPSATGTAVPAGSSTRPAGNGTSAPAATLTVRSPTRTVAASGNVASTGSSSVTVSPPAGARG